MSNFAFVQATTCNGASVQSFPSSVTAGSCIIVAVIAGAVSTVTDSQGNTYRQVQSNSAGTLWAAINVTGGSVTVTASPSGGALWAAEYSSANPSYSVCPGCSNPTVFDAPTITNTVPPGSLFTSSAEVMAVFVCWQQGTIGGFSCPGTTMRMNASIPQSFGTVCGAGDVDVPSISGSWSVSPLLSSVGNSPSRSWGVFLNLTGNCPGTPLAITCGSPPTGVIGSPYAHTFPVTGGVSPFTFAITAGSLPPGLTLNTSSGAVTGTPTTAGTYPITVQVTDSESPAITASVNCSITIGGGGPWIIKEITAELIPSKDPIDGRGHWRYTVRCVDQAQAGTYQEFWNSLGGGSSTGGSASAFGVSSTAAGAPSGPPGAQITVAKNGTAIGTESEINLIEGTGITITASDDPSGGKVDVTISAPASGLQMLSQTFSSVTSVTFNHNLGRAPVVVQCFDNGSPQLKVDPEEIKITGGNQVVVTFGNTFSGEIVVIG